MEIDKGNGANSSTDSIIGLALQMNLGGLIEQAKAQMSCSCKPGLVPTFGYKISKMFSSKRTS